ncbi:Fur family transcriptional regulator [uncultured Neptuniibacter sp.]|uniref:Fur family transcriptional regulator n=1 Tax=uncultured Neptuniibacter sp. TaxID=502143 RepID=UPI0026369390|nr:Fur family transcriptional regulator [uncultured Neptuniibacter sp.]
MDNSQLAFRPGHNHTDCIAHALEDARLLCKNRNLRFTPIRELVLKTIWQSHKPLGAYELLPVLAEAGYNSAPPTVYRALEFLQEQGLVHRIALLNAYIGCPHPNEQHEGSFLICHLCNNAVEIDTQGISSEINKQAALLGFTPEKQSIEVLGLCPSCKAGSAA